MAFHEVLAALRARWVIVAAVLLCAAAGGVYVLHGAPVYQATAAAVLVPPKEPSAPNALASTTPSIAAAGLAVDDILLSPGETAALRAQGVVDGYSIVPRNNGTTETPAYSVPSEQFTITGGNATTLLTEINTLMNDYAAKLHGMQSAAGVIAKAQITDGVLAPATVVQLHGSRSRGAVGIALLGLGAAIAAAVRFRPRRVPPRAVGARGDGGALAAGGKDTKRSRSESTDAVLF